MVIDYQNINIYIDDYLILKDINLKVEENHFIFITGVVGSGKSTFLKSLYAATNITGNKATVLDIDLLKIKVSHIPQLRRMLGIVFQDFQLLNDRTIFDNLDFVLKATGWKKREEREHRIEEVLQTVKLTDKKDKFPHELSGGEQQRIAIARSILNKPKLIIADEPTGSLDVNTRIQILNILKEIRNQGTTIVMCTHNLSLLDMVPDAYHYICENHQLILQPRTI